MVDLEDLHDNMSNIHMLLNVPTSWDGWGKGCDHYGRTRGVIRRSKTQDHQASLVKIMEEGVEIM